MKEAYVYEKSSTTTQVPQSDNSGLILGMGLVIVAIILGAVFLFFTYNESNRAIDAVNAQTEAQIESARSTLQQQEPLVIDRPVMVPVEKPVVIEKEVIREVPVATPATDDAAQ